MQARYKEPELLSKAPQRIGLVIKYIYSFQALKCVFLYHRQFSTRA